MAIDDVPEQEPLPMDYPPRREEGGKVLVVFLVLLLLVIGQVYILVKISSLRQSLEAQQANTRKELTTQLQDTLARRLGALERSNAEQLGALKEELDTTAQRMGSTGQELNRARTIVSRLRKQQQEEMDSLRGELAQKANQEQLGALSQDVNSTRTDLDSTKRVLDSTRSELGMTRSEFGTLIARNHDEIEQLRKMGDRDYYEFRLNRNQPQRLAGVILNLKKTNPKRHRFNLNLTVDDLEVEKKDRTINEPIFFYVSGAKKPFEIVVNEVKSEQVGGYLSTPKGAREAAAR
jgi:hypothetical protein